MTAAAAGRSVQLDFPHYAPALLEALNRQRLAGQFCDVAVHVGGRVFAAHKSVLAAASPYFHDKLLLRRGGGGRLALPAVMEAEAFGNLLQLVYSGRLTLPLEALPGHLLVASGLQMWPVVDRCARLLKELEGGPPRRVRLSPGGDGERPTLGGEEGAAMEEPGLRVVEPEAAGKPVDLHGNELLVAPAGGRALHGPVKVAAAAAAADGKRFGCLCGKRFAAKPKRDRHVTLTLSLRPFGCVLCDKRFKLKHHLTEHMKTHGGARAGCGRCGRRIRVRPGFLQPRQRCEGQAWACE